MKWLFVFIVCLAYSPLAQARPVSYPGGVTAITTNDINANTALLHYSPTASISLGLRSEYRRDGEYFLNAVQMNNLLKRWNSKASQANIYLRSGVGVASSESGDLAGQANLAAFTGILADWETRRYSVAYENRYVEAGGLDDFFAQRARIGIAPYIGDYGDLHTWLILQVDHKPEDRDAFTVTPIIRFLKGVALVEAGVDNNGDVLFNATYRF